LTLNDQDAYIIMTIIVSVEEETETVIQEGGRIEAA